MEDQGIREEAAESIDSAARNVRSIAEGAAGRLDSTADFVRNYSPLGDLRDVMRKSPGMTLCIGIATGLLVGFTLRRS